MNRPMTHLLLISALLLPQARAKDAAPVIDDRQIRAQFESSLGKVKDAGETPDPQELQQQLKERGHHALELAPPAADAATMPTSAVYAARKESVLCFGNIYKCNKCNHWHGNIAGGFVISADGVAVTNYHVMENAEAGAFGAMTADGKLHVVKEVLAASKRDDLAIVQLDGDGFSPAPLSDSEPVGAKVIAISHPEGRFYTVSEGIISRYYKQVERSNGPGADRVSITADFAKGSSGCPVFSASGAVVGVVSSTNSIYYDRTKDGDESNLQMVIKSCIPSSAILKLLREDQKNSDGKAAS